MELDDDFRVVGDGSSSRPGGITTKAVHRDSAISGGLDSTTTATTVATAADLLPLPHREGNERSVRLLAARNGDLPRPRVYEVWSELGYQNRAVCRGRCVTGPHIDFWYSCCAWSFIVVPSLLYFVLCAKWLWVNVSPWLPILTGLIFASTISLLLLTACSDPGVIPRHSLQRAVPGLAEEVAAAIGAGPPLFDAATSEPVVELTGQQVAQGYRWCPTCKVIKPPRASHCKDCDQCVLTWDHHCPFVNNCVGQRNYAYFSGFLCSTLCLGVAVFSGMGLYFYYTSSGGDSHSSVLSGPALYALIALIGLPTGLLALGVLGLSLFHACLCCFGRTTKEAYNSIFKGQATRGGRTLSSWRTPSLLHLRDRVNLPLTVV